MKRLSITAVFLISIFYSFGQTNSNNLGQDAINTITTAVPFLLIAPDARGGGMGDVGVASTPDANSIHWNPAKYIFAPRDFGAAVSYSPWLRALVNDINLAYLAGYWKINPNNAVAASLRFFSLGNITFTNENGESTGQYRPNEFAIDVSYARKLSDHISMAVSGRYIYSNLTLGQTVGNRSTHAGQSGAADVGFYYRLPIEFKRLTSLFAVGVNITNIGAKISYTENTEKDFLPTNLKFGVGYTLEFDKYNSLSAFLDINKLLVPTPPIYGPKDSITGNQSILNGKDPNVGIVTGMLQSFYDAPNGFSEEIKEYSISLGLEYWYDKQFSIRAGYFNESQMKGNRKFFTLGAGIRYSVFGLDFAYLIPTIQHHPLENTLRFTLLFDFNKPKTVDKKS